MDRIIGVASHTIEKNERQRFNLNMGDVNLKDLTNSLTAFVQSTSITGPAHAASLPHRRSPVAQTVCLLHLLRNLIQQQHQQQKLGITPALEPE